MQKKRALRGKAKRIFGSPVFWGIVGFCCYLPYFLAFYPGVITPDPLWQLEQALHLTNYQNQHPFLHTLMIEACLRLSGGEVNRGVAVYSLLQMGILSAAYMTVIHLLKKNHAPTWFLVILWIFYFLCPMNGIYSITMWKDVPFSAAVLVLTVYMWHRIRNELSWGFKDKAVFIVLSVLVSLLRSNGLIAWCIFLAALFLARRDVFKKILAPSLIALAATLLFLVPFQKAMQVESSDLTEAISIPLQQVTYTVMMDEEDPSRGRLSEEDKAELSEIMNLEEVADHHDSAYSNETKDLVKRSDGGNKIKAEPLKYLGLYVRIGLKNLDTYVKAYVDGTYGYYLPSLGESASYCSEIMDNDFGLYRTYLLPYNMVIFMYNVLNVFTRVYTYAWCAAFNFYILLASMIVLVIRARRLKKKSRTGNTKAYRSLRTEAVYMLPLGVFLTVLISTPAANDVRYVYSLFLTWLPGIYMALAKPRA